MLPKLIQTLVSIFKIYVSKFKFGKELCCYAQTCMQKCQN